VAGYAKMVYPQTVTHPSINRTRQTVTMLNETNKQPLSQASINCPLMLVNQQWWLCYYVVTSWVDLTSRSTYYRSFQRQFP